MEEKAENECIKYSIKILKMWKDKEIKRCIIEKIYEDM